MIGLRNIFERVRWIGPQPKSIITVHPLESIIKLQGRDGLDFLHRLSTNALSQLEPGHARSTILLTEKGRCVEAITVFSDSQGLWIESPAGSATKIIEWLNKFIMMEDVQLCQIDTELQKLTILGEEAEDLLQQRFVHWNALNRGEGRKFSTVDGDEAFVVRDPLLMFDCWNVYASNKVVEWLTAPSQPSSVEVSVTSPDDLLEFLRIASASPAPKKEIRETVNPLEIGLRHLIDFKKGCYLGQEVIARLDTYEKVQRQLVSFACEAKPFPIEQGSDVYLGDSIVGNVTSVCQYPQSEKQVIMGLIKRKEASSSDYSAVDNESRKVKLDLLYSDGLSASETIK